MSSVRVVVFAVAVGMGAGAVGMAVVPVDFPLIGAGAETDAPAADDVDGAADSSGPALIDCAAVALETLTSGPGPCGEVVDALVLSAAIAELPAPTLAAPPELR